MRTLLIPLTACCRACGGEASEKSSIFNRDITPITLQNCTPCYRPEGSTSLNRLSRREVIARTERIAHVIQSRHIPLQESKLGYGYFAEEHNLCDSEIIGNELEGDPRRPAAGARVGPAAGNLSSSIWSSSPYAPTMPTSSTISRSRCRSISI